jgi:1,4-alpha-glucan branching enzyme
MLHKQTLAGKKVLVTFAMPAIEGVESLHVCGDFNDWSETATPLARKADGSWHVQLTLDAGQSYRFRYKDNHGLWHNDPTADAYVPNAFGSENSVLDLAAVMASTAAAQAETARTRPAARRTPARSKKGAPAPRRRDGGGKRPRGKRK